jgi:hypothetical protein
MRGDFAVQLAMATMNVQCFDVELEVERRPAGAAAYKPWQTP